MTFLQVISMRFDGSSWMCCIEGKRLHHQKYIASSIMAIKAAQDERI